MENFNLKKLFFYLLICSIALSALMGIWAILSGEFGELQGKILATTSTVVGTSILGLACGAFLESPRARPSLLRIVPIAGIILTIVSAAIILWLIWSADNWGEKIIFKTLSISLIFAFSLAQLSLISLARLARRFRWATVSAYVVVPVLALIVSALIIVEPRSEDGLAIRLIGILAVTDAAITVMTPIFHFLSRTEFIDDSIPSTTEIDREIAKLKVRIARLEKQKEDILNAEIKS